MLRVRIGFRVVDAPQRVHTVQFFHSSVELQGEQFHRLSPFLRKGRASYLSTSPQVIRAMSVEMARILASTRGCKGFDRRLTSPPCTSLRNNTTQQLTHFGFWRQTVLF